MVRGGENTAILDSTSDQQPGHHLWELWVELEVWDEQRGREPRGGASVLHDGQDGSTPRAESLHGNEERGAPARDRLSVPWLGEAHLVLKPTSKSKELGLDLPGDPVPRAAVRQARQAELGKEHDECGRNCEECGEPKRG